MHLKDVNEKLNHKIVSGSEYGWNCYPNARFLEYESDYAHVSAVFDSQTQTIYEIEVSVKQEWYEDSKPYRWLNPNTKDLMIAEAKKRKVKYRKAWDDVKYIDLDLEQDFFEKCVAIFNGQKFDKRVQMEVDLDDDTILLLAKEAHKRDITLNQMIEEILKKLIDERELKEFENDYAQDLG